MKLYATMDHRGGLKESLETQHWIDPHLAKYLIDIGIYNEYTYDERIKAKRYIFRGPMSDMLWQIPTWLLEFDYEPSKEEKKNEERREISIPGDAGQAAKQ